MALSPTFHRAFDQGYFTISGDYRVLVHPAVNDSSPAHSLRQRELRMMNYELGDYGLGLAGVVLFELKGIINPF
ncbi:MAG: hypothetical protein K9H84_06405 [Bacteroidales bacterium]|nr:hypothetical protein [Bacteroidales bacterium]